MAEDEKIIEACKNNSLNRLKMDELKSYLRKVGQYVTGNKAELVERVKGACKLRLGDVSQLKESDRLVLLKRNDEKLRTPLGEVMAHSFNIACWHNDVTFIPDLSEKDIYNYFVYKLNTKRQLKSKVMYEDRHIHEVQVNDTDENESHCFVRCKAIPSMPSTNKKTCPDYDVWVMLSKMTGCINSAECSCTAGNGEGCNHIAALLYAIADITDKKKDGTLASTSMKCKWNNPRKRKLTPRKSQDLDFSKIVHGRTSVKRKLPVNVYANNKTVNVENFKQKLLKLDSNVGWLRNFQLNTNLKPVPKLHDINLNFSRKVNLQDHQDFFMNHFNSLKTTELECLTIECMTRNQCMSDLWTLARKERLTASYFGKICKMKTSTKPDSTLKDILNYRTFESFHTKYGQDHEDLARRRYLKEMKKSHPGINVKKCGLLITPEYPHLGASPDGFVNCTHCEHHNGLLEIKCPSSDVWRLKTPEQCAEDPKFFCSLDDDGNLVLKKHHNYYYQVQGQLSLSGRKWCDFVSWTCKNISIQRIYADNDFFKHCMLPSLNAFYVKAFIPELFSCRVKHGLPLYD